MVWWSNHHHVPCCLMINKLGELPCIDPNMFVSTSPDLHGKPISWGISSQKQSCQIDEVQKHVWETKSGNAWSTKKTNIRYKMYIITMYTHYLYYIYIYTRNHTHIKHRGLHMGGSRKWRAARAVRQIYRTTRSWLRNCWRRRDWRAPPKMVYFMMENMELTTDVDMV